MYACYICILEPDELFARVLFLSAKKSKMAELDIELPAKSEHGKFNFKQLEVRT